MSESVFLACPLPEKPLYQHWERAPSLSLETGNEHIMAKQRVCNWGTRHNLEVTSIEATLATDMVMTSGHLNWIHVYIRLICSKGFLFKNFTNQC